MKAKKLLAFLLSALMVIGMIPFTAIGAETDAGSDGEAAVSNPHVEPTLSSDAVVYVSGEGSDDNDGASPEAPVKTLTKAVEILGENGGTVIVCESINIADEPLAEYEYTKDGTTETLPDGRFEMPAHKGLVRITTVDSGINYGASINFGMWNDYGSNKSHHFIIGGPTTFENINFATESNPVFYGRGHFLTMGEGITSTHTMLVIGYDQITTHTKGVVRSTDSDTHIIIKSGNYHTIAGMTRNANYGAYLGTAYITIGAGAGNIGTLAGLATEGSYGYYGNAVVELNGGTITNFAGAAYSMKYASFGNVEVTVNKVTHKSGRFDGMATSSTACSFGDVKMTINAGSFNTIEGYAYNATDCVFGNSDLTVNGGSCSYLNGVLMSDGRTSGCTVADAKTTFNGGSVTNYVTGGSFRTGFTADSVTLTMNSSNTFSKAVCGVNMTGVATVNDSVTLNINDGTYTTYVVAGSYGFKSTDTSKPETKLLGSPDMYINVTGGNIAFDGGGLFLGMSSTTANAYGRVYYNISGGTIVKVYVGQRQAPVASSQGMYFTYSGGSIGKISTAWLSNYQKYYFVGDKTFETTTFETGTQTGYPGLGANAFNYVNIGSEYPDAVYVSTEGAGGDYVNDGLTPETPLQSIYDAALTLGPDGGTIYMMDDTPGVYTPKTEGTLTFSAILPGESEPNGHGFNLDSGNLYLESNVVFDGVTFTSTKTERLIAFQGHDVTINDNCQMVLTNTTVAEDDTVTTTTGSIALLLGYSQNADNYMEGAKTATQVNVYRDQTVNINGGEWISLYGGNRRFGQSASVGTYYGDVTINVGAGATFTNNTPADDTYPNNAVYLTGSNIVKGNVTANLAGTFNTPVYGVGKLGVYYNGQTDSTKGTTYFGTDGITILDDTKFEGNVTINATGIFNGNIDAILRAGDTPLYGDFTLNATGIFADGIKSDAKGVMGTTTYVGSADIDTVNYDTVNGVANKNSAPIRVITIGDSITWGSAAKGENVDGYDYHLYNFNYPAQLQNLLGEGAIVGNFGYPGARAQYGVSNDYYGSASYGLTLNFGDADAIIIALGTNESAALAAGGTPEFYEESMRRLIDTYHTAYPNATIYITTALPRFGTQAYTDAVEQIVMPIQRRLAADYEYTKLMDLYTDMLPYAEIDKNDGSTIYFADKLHPTNLGYSLMAGAVAEDIKADLCYYECEHRDPTCTEVGGDYYVCVWCGKYYTENTTDALGHDLYESDRLDATTDAEGYIEYTCSVCGHTEREILPILGKTYTEIEVFAPTCTEQGFTRHYCDQDDSYYDDTFVPALGHDHVTTTVAAGCENNGSITTTCTRCDYENVEIIEAKGHVIGSEATCTKDQICNVCGTVIVAAYGHDIHTVVVAPTATMVGYTDTCCTRGDYSERTDYVNATEKLVIFVDTTVAKTGDGTVDAPLKTYSEAMTFADVSFERIIVLKSMVSLTSNYTEREHTAHYTVTSLYDGVKYNGGFDVKGGYHYILSGETTFENLTLKVSSTLVIRCMFNSFTAGEGVVMNGGSTYVVGADQNSSSKCDTTKDTNITLLSGTYIEVIGGHRSGVANDITGTINLYIGGTAVIDKVFLGNRSATSKGVTDANLTLDGGVINYFVTASDVTAATMATGAAKGTVTVNVTKNFDVTKSFTKTGGNTFSGFSLANPFNATAQTVRDAYGTYILNVATEVYAAIVDGGYVFNNSIHELNRTGKQAADIDGDGAITNSDITLLVRYLSGWDVEVEVVDLNGDAKINNRDAMFLIMMVVNSTEEE